MRRDRVDVENSRVVVRGGMGRVCSSPIMLASGRGAQLGVLFRDAQAIENLEETTPAALRALKEDGLKLIMLTGDNAATARAVAADLPIDEVIAEVQPKDKADVIARLQSQGASVAMAVMASITHPRSPRHTPASLWERGLILRWRVRRSRW